MTPELAYFFGVRAWEIEQLTDGELRAHVDWIERYREAQRRGGA